MEEYPMLITDNNVRQPIAIHVSSNDLGPNTTRVIHTNGDEIHLIFGTSCEY